MEGVWDFQMPSYVEHFTWGGTMKKEKDFLVCIDSDGCVMDTMDIKHAKCLAPCMLKVWGLEKYRLELIARWREINIYSLDRGINRFLGLARMLGEIHDNYKRVDGLEGYLHWVNTTEELSEESLRKEYEDTGNECIRKAIAWSELVNGSMDFMHDGEAVPFGGVREALEEISKVADIAVVSAANKQEVEKEWRQHGLDKYAGIYLTQEEGSKGHSIQRLMEAGYEKDHVLMIGDAPGDKEAADQNDVLFYPILAREEDISWEDFLKGPFEKFLEGSYRGEYQEKLNKAFFENL